MSLSSYLPLPCWRLEPNLLLGASVRVSSHVWITSPNDPSRERETEGPGRTFAPRRAPRVQADFNTCTSIGTGAEKA